jgi:hypothetical protein
MADATHARVTLHALIVCAGLATSACWVGDDCHETINKTIEVALPATPQMQLVINSCMLDSGACPMLCSAVLEQQQIVGSTPTTCTVGFQSDKVVVHVGFEVYSTESSKCSEPIPPFADGGFLPTNGR